MYVWLFPYMFQYDDSLIKTTKTNLPVQALVYWCSHCPLFTVKLGSSLRDINKWILHQTSIFFVMEKVFSLFLYEVSVRRDTIELDPI